MMRRWNRFWFEDASPYNPMGAMRIVAVLVFVRKLDFLLGFMSGSVDLPEGFLARVLGHALVPLAYPLPESLHEPLRVALLAAAGAALVGVFTRLALALLFVASVYLTSGIVGLYFFDHEWLLTVYVLGILVVAPGTTQLSIDRTWRWWRDGRREPLSAIASLSSGNAWGRKLILAVMATVYVAAGISKLRWSDGLWLNGETLGFYLSRTESTQLFLGRRGDFEPVLEDGLLPLVDHTYGHAAHPAVRPWSRIEPLMRMMAIATVLLELSAVLLLAGPPLRTPMLFAFLLMHTGIGHAMGLGFPSYRAYILCLIDWPWIVRTVRRRMRRAEQDPPVLESG